MINNLLLYCLIEVHGEWNLNVLNLRKKKKTSINLRSDRCVIYQIITMYTLNILKFCQLYFDKAKQNKINGLSEKVQLK